MAIKKYTLLLAVLVMLQLTSNAQTQTDWGWDWKDSSKVPTKSIPQYNEFLNNQFPYPPKPRSAWELGFSAGSAFVVGDRALFVKNSFGKRYDGGQVVSISLRKALGHVISLRGQTSYSRVSIPAYSRGGINVSSGSNNTLTVSLDAIASFNAINFYRGNPKVDWYVLGGYSIIATQVKKRQPNNELRLINFPKSQTFGTIQDLTLLHGVDVGAGMAFKLNNTFNIGLEQKFVVPMLLNDNLDGFRTNTNSNDTDFFSYTSIRLNINLGVKGK